MSPQVKGTAAITAPHLRGLVILRAGAWLGTEIDRASRRFLTVPYAARKRFMFSVISIYAARSDTVVELDTAQGTRPFRRFFARSKFPFLSFGARAENSYKSWNVLLGFVNAKGAMSINVRETRNGDVVRHRICDILPVKDAELINDLSALEKSVAAAITAPETTSLAKIAPLDRSLAVIELADTSGAATKARVTLFNGILVNHKSAFRKLEKWTAAEKAAGRGDQAAAFKQSLAATTSPIELGRHGYFPSFRNLDLTKVEADLAQLMQRIKSLGVDPFINSGTLLGYHRDGRPIVHDDDFDLAAIIPGETEAEVFANWHRFIVQLTAAMPVIDKGPFVAVMLPDGVQVDIFPAWTLNGKAYVYPYCWEDFSQAALLPLSTMPIRDQVFAVPADIEAVLGVNYGPSWRVPDPFWQFNYTRARRLFKKALQELKSR